MLIATVSPNEGKWKDYLSKLLRSVREGKREVKGIDHEVGLTTEPDHVMLLSRSLNEE